MDSDNKLMVGVIQTVIIVTIGQFISSLTQRVLTELKAIDNRDVRVLIPVCLGVGSF